ncbi:MAG TPA: hypothetical protein VEC57_05605 [Candidatus Limnocylindrales bacterium]|nr:hypothetical protein [Candidatus Limnocylindrales bacterium]
MLDLRLIPMFVMAATVPVAAAIGTTAFAQECALAVSGEGPPKASDALAVLRAAVGSLACQLCVCDVDRSGNTTASDSLATLKAAVGQDIRLRCVACPVTETIGVAGGTVTSADGRFEIRIPKDGVGADVEVTVAGKALSRLGDAFGDVSLTDAYEVLPEGLQIVPPAAVIVHADATRQEDGSLDAPIEVILVEEPDASLLAGGAAGVDGVLPLLGDATVDVDVERVRRQAEIVRAGEVGIGRATRVRLRLPASPPVDLAQPVEVGFGGATGVEEHSYRAVYEDELANHFLPMEGVPLMTPPISVGTSGHLLSIDYICDRAGPHDYLAKATLDAFDDAILQFYTQEVFLQGTIRCVGPVALATDFAFTDGCAGTLLPFGPAGSGAKIACTGGGVSDNGVRVMLPQEDPDTFAVPPVAELITAGVKESAPTFDVAILPAPGESPNDAVLAVGATAQLWRYDPQSGNLHDVFPVLMGSHNFVDVSHPVQEQGSASAVMIDAATSSFFLFEYDGTASPAPPQLLLGATAFDDAGVDGGLATGRIRTSSGPLIGSTLGNGLDPGTIFFHDLVDPQANVTVIGEGGLDPQVMDCAGSLCVQTSAADDAMTVISWPQSGLPTILDTVSLSDDPVGAKVFALGGTRYFVVTASRGEDLLDLTVIDTAGDKLVESSSQSAMPPDCQQPSTVGSVGADSVVVNCAATSTFAYFPGIVPAQ